MRKELIETGKTVDAAIDSACEKLGCSRDDCQWEIIDLPKKTLLGLKTIPAKVKVSVDLPDPKPAQAAPVERKIEQKPSPAKPAPVAPAPVNTGPVAAAEPPRAAPPAAAPKTSDAEAPEAAFPMRKLGQDVLITEGFTEKEIVTMDYITGILREFGIHAKLNLYRNDGGIYINIAGDGLGTIIGRRGETLDAIQYLAGLVANRAEGDYMRVTLDCGDYRAKRKETLEALAKKLAAQVLKTNVSKTLEPMNPFERRVIHAAVSEIEGVTSSSIGEEPNRRVVITSPTARRASSRGGRNNSRDHMDGNRRPPRSGGRDRMDGNRRPPRNASRSQPVQRQDGPPKQTPEAAAFSNTPIGKLDLE